MEYAIDTHSQPWDVVGFAFSELQPIQPNDKDGNVLSSQAVSIHFLNQFQERFPHLFDSVNGDLEKAYEMLITKFAGPQIEAHSQLRQAGFNSSPIFVIDGQTIVGMNADSIEKALADAHHVSNEGEFCSDNNSTECSK